MKKDLGATLSSVNPLKLEQVRQQVLDEIASSNPPKPSTVSDGDDDRIEAANKFSTRLDTLTDVMLLLTLKFGRATTALFAGGVIFVVCTVMMIIALVNIFDVSSRLKDMQDQQAIFEKTLTGLEKQADETRQKVSATEKTVTETQEQVKTAVDATPKVEVDKHGHAKVVLSTVKAPKTAVPKKGVPLDTEVELR